MADKTNGEEKKNEPWLTKTVDIMGYKVQNWVLVVVLLAALYLLHTHGYLKKLEKFVLADKSTLDFKTGVTDAGSVPAPVVNTLRNLRQ